MVLLNKTNKGAKITQNQNLINDFTPIVNKQRCIYHTQINQKKNVHMRSMYNI